MDRNILHALMNEDIITSMVDPKDYTDVDDLIDKGIVTVPGSKERILEILDSLNIEHIDVNPTVIEPVVEVLLDETPIDNEPIAELNIIDETPVSEPVIDETPVSEPVIDETPVSEPVIDETPEKEAPTIVETVEVKEKKTTKKTKKTE